MSFLSRPEDRLPDLGDGRAAVLSSFAKAIRPPVEMSVSQWAAQYRWVSAESGSPNPGLWENWRVPHLVEIMDGLNFGEPCQRIAVKGPAQSAKSEGGVNFIGYLIDREPCSILVVLPSLDEAKKYNKVKLQPTIAESEVLKNKVRDERSRDSSGSTALMKRFRGGWIIVTGANSSKGLQMISARVLIREELSEWPEDVDNRGDPAEMAEARLTAYRARGYKILDVSTPKNAGACRITEYEEAGDRRRRYLPCPHCGHFQQLPWERFRFRFRDADGRPVPAHFVCLHCEREIHHHHKQAMNAAGVWVPTFVEADAELAAANPPPPALIAPAEVEGWSRRPTGGRHRSYHWWAVLNGFESWEDIAADYRKAEGRPDKLKVFTQQKLAEAWEEVVDVPDAVRLAERTADFPLRTLPEGACFFIGMADVQHDRIEWSVYAVGPFMTMWEIDFGVIPGDPNRRDVWDRLWPVTQARYPNARGRLWPIEAFGIDSGYLSNQVYIFCRRAPNLYATDGRHSPLHPAVGAPSLVDVTINGKVIKGGAQIWPLGTHAMKVEVYGALNQTLLGPDEHGAFQPGALIASKKRGVEHFEQLTAEVLDKDEETGKRRWRKRQKNQPNEALDIAVGARALAYHVGASWLDDAAWAQLLEDRQAAPPEATDLFAAALAPRAPAAEPAAPAAAEPPVPEAPPAGAPEPANGVRSIASLLA